MPNSGGDHFQWIDDLIKRWPFFIFILGLLSWATTMQLGQSANAAELQKISKQWPDVVNKLDTMDNKLTAVLNEMGYEVKFVAVKKPGQGQGVTVAHQ